MNHTPDSVMDWLYANYSGQVVAGQDLSHPEVQALVGWCNATRNLQGKNLSARDRKQAEESVARGAAYLEIIT